MQDHHLRSLLLGAGVALVTVGLARTDLALAAVWTTLCCVAALRRWAWPAGLAALPALFAALPPPPALAAALSPGPHRLRGTVVEVRRDPQLKEQALLLDTPGGRLWLHTDDASEVLPGDTVTATARCSPPAIPGERGPLQAATDACTIDPGKASLPRLCAAARRAIEKQLLHIAPGEQGLVLTTLVLGNGTRLPGDVAAAHRATGLSHLLAVSGAHAAMLAWLLGLQPFGAGRRRPVGRVHLAVALTLLLVYGAITGLEPPVFRALCSYVLVAAGLQLGRRVSPIQGLAWPALVSAVVAPAGVLGPSYCLSYAAVAGLALAGGPRDEGHLERWLLAPIRASMWATLTTAPLTLFWFGQIAPWTVVLTPLLAPLVGAMLFLGLGAALLTLVIPALTVLLAPPLALLATTYVDCVAAADGLPATPVFAATVPSLPLLLAGVGAGIAAFAILKDRRGALLGCVAACLPHFAPIGAAAPALHLFAVGHGQACLCTLADGHTLLIDCGSLQHASLPARRVERALRTRRIDLLVLTHGDRDHIGAVGELLRRVPINRVVLPAKLQGSDVVRDLSAHGCALTFLLPGSVCAPLTTVVVAAPAPVRSSSNDDSLWVRIDLPGLRILSAGDAEEDGVRAALAAGIAAPADVLVLPHHGRHNDAAGTLLSAVSPRCCLVSNRHGEGVSALGELALQRGLPTFATGVAGDLSVEFPRWGDPGGGSGDAQILLPAGLQLPARR